MAVHILVKKWQRILLLVAVIILTSSLRSIHSDRVPTYGHLEEHLYGWSGIYLLEEGVPVSWSTLDYPEEKKIFKGALKDKYTFTQVYVDLVKPWLDEPPLFSLILGASAKAFGADRHSVLPSSYLRFPMIFIACLTSIVLFLFSQKLFGYWIGLTSVFLWGTIPLMVFSSRLAVPENAISLLYLLSLYLFLLYQNKPKKGLFFSLLILPGIAGLMKPTGFFIAPFISFLFFKDKKWKKGAIALLAVIPSILGFISYGLYYDPRLFWHIISIQGFRPVGWNALAYILSTPAFDIFPFYDSWYIFAWVAAFFFILLASQESTLREKGVNILSWALIYWILVILFSGGEQDLLPWYRYPIFPLLAIYASLGIRHLLKFPGFLSLALAAGLLLGNRVHLVNAFHPNTTASVFRLEFLLLILPGLLYTIWQHALLKRIIFLTLCLILILGTMINFLVVKDYYKLICEAKVCPIGPSTILTR